MATKAKKKAQERSTFVAVVGFYEVSFDSPHSIRIFPKSINWTLTDMEGNIINDRDSVPLPPSYEATISLSGDDLALSGDYPEERILTVFGLYDSAHGTDLPYMSQLIFQIENAVGVI